MPAAKNCHNLSYEICRSTKESLHADQARDLRRFDSCPGLNDSAGAGQAFRCPEGGRTIGGIALQRPAAGGRRDLDPGRVSGIGLPRTNPAQIRDAKPGRKSPLSRRATTSGPAPGDMTKV